MIVIVVADVQRELACQDRKRITRQEQLSAGRRAAAHPVGWWSRVHIYLPVTLLICYPANA